MTTITTCNLPCGVSVLVRPMTNDQVDRFNDLRQSDQKIHAPCYAIGCCLLEADQSPVFTQEVDETDVLFSKRVYHDSGMSGEDILAFIRHLDLVERTMAGRIRRWKH